MKHYVRRMLQDSLRLVILFVIGICSAATALAETRSSSDAEPSKRAILDLKNVPMELKNLPFLQEDSNGALGARLPGEYFEVSRQKRTAVQTENLTSMPLGNDDEEEAEKLSGERIPSVAQMKSKAEFEFFEVATQRHFVWVIDRAELAKISRQKSRLSSESDRIGKPIPRKDIDNEDRIKKSWSKGTDNRTRRAIGDGFPNDHSIYQRIANYGACTANVLSANSERMIAITAAHCIFTSRSEFDTSPLWPRANGNKSRKWGAWDPYAFGYYSAFLDKNCDDNWDGGRCTKHDIALVFAKPEDGAKPPLSMGWAYRSKSFLKDRSKYRRGYPNCDLVDSPAGCRFNRLFGDGKLSVGSFSKLNGDLWNRQFKFSSDVSPGDSGSGLYYFRNGYPYVFGVASTMAANCRKDCKSKRPNYGRRITPDFFDFINSVM